MTLLKADRNKKILVASVGISIVTIIVVISFSSCGLQHVLIVKDLKFYENSQDPEFCFDLLTKINNFNDECTPTIEILDCG